MPKQLLYQNTDGEVLTEEELEQRFCDWLDEEHPRIELGDVGFSHSAVLKGMDPIAFRGQMWAWMGEEWQELSSYETEVTLESWQRARDDARTP